MCSRSLAVKLLSVLVRAWLVVVVAAGPAGAAEPESCRVVRFSDVGWTDITVTTALTSTLLEALGYRPHTDMLAMLVTYESLKNRQIDVFLGAWEPSGGAQRAPYLADGSVDVAGKNLSGARFTLAVPSYVSAAGVRDFADLARFADRFQHRIYGIEPGNDGNRLIAQLIREGHRGLEDWTLVESSEQGMLSEVDRAVRKKEWIVFLGWSPHPMNLRYDMTYLAGGDDTFGPNYGGASVYTDVRHGYLTECPNVARLLRNLHFDTGMESAMMAAILVDKRDARTATRLWLESHFDVAAGWLDGVTTFDGKSGTDALRRALAPTGSAAGSSLERANQWLLHHKIPVGDWLSRSVQLITEHARGPLDGFSAGMGGTIAVITAALLRIPALVLLPVLVMVAYLVLRSIAFALFVGLSLLLIVNLGYWVATIETLSLVLCATGLSTLIGVPIGIVSAHRPWLYRLIQPILDLMQTIPTFVYLIPALVLFGLGTVPGLIATVVFAIPAPIRLTHLGISSVPKPLREAGLAFGATPLQLLVKVELPYASPTIMAGVTQCIMLSLSMVVIAALVGADGLGKPVVRALNSVNIAMGFEAGIAIVVLAIILDRLCKGRRSSSPII